MKTDMTAEELINHMIPPLKITDDVHKAMLWMEELRCNQLPVIDNGKFLGFIHEDSILEANDIEMDIRDIQLDCPECVIGLKAHFYEILKVSGNFNSEMVAVISENGEYAGVITVRDTVTSFAQSAAVQIPGGIIVLSLKQIDYSLAEISRLIEENNAKILSSSVKEDEHDNSMLKVTIKVNRTELAAIVATLERFGYRVIARFQESRVNDEEKGRLDMLLKYLDI